MDIQRKNFLRGAVYGALVVIVAVGIGVAWLTFHTDVPQATAASAQAPREWSRTKPYPVRDVYYPGTEEIKPDEMRVIACGTGMPQPRLKQAAACYLVELGNPTIE